MPAGDQSKNSNMITVSRDQWTQPTSQTQTSTYSTSNTTSTTDAWVKNQDESGPYHALAQVSGTTGSNSGGASQEVAPSMIPTQGSAKK